MRSARSTSTKRSLCVMGEAGGPSSAHATLKPSRKEGGQRLARPGHEEPAVARAGAAGVVEQHLGRVVRPGDAEKLNQEKKHELLTLIRPPLTKGPAAWGNPPGAPG